MQALERSHAGTKLQLGSDLTRGLGAGGIHLARLCQHLFHLGALRGREREVLTLVGEGKSSPEIAKHLGLSVKTIEGHRGRIMAKLECRNVAGLVRQAIRLGLVKAE